MIAKKVREKTTRARGKKVVVQSDDDETSLENNNAIEEKTTAKNKPKPTSQETEESADEAINSVKKAQNKSKSIEQDEGADEVIKPVKIVQSKSKSTLPVKKPTAKSKRALVEDDNETDSELLPEKDVETLKRNSKSKRPVFEEDAKSEVITKENKLASMDVEVPESTDSIAHAKRSSKKTKGINNENIPPRDAVDADVSEDDKVKTKHQDPHLAEHNIKGKKKKTIKQNVLSKPTKESVKIEDDINIAILPAVIDDIIQTSSRNSSPKDTKKRLKPSESPKSVKRSRLSSTDIQLPEQVRVLFTAVDEADAFFATEVWQYTKTDDKYFRRLCCDGMARLYSSYCHKHQTYNEIYMLASLW